ncbi:MAG TPA: glycosyltransferase family 39 protein [Candidatus Paceibacterota bacterium]
MKKAYLLLFLIIIIAAILRLANLTTIPPGLYPDEAMNGNNALEALKAGDFKVFYPENNGREGLFINIQALFVRFLGNEAWVLRLPSALFGVLTVLGVYFLTKELFNGGAETENLKLKSRKYIALLAAFLLATSFWHINFSRMGFRAIMAPFFLTWAVYFLILAFRKNPLFALAGGIAYGLGFYSYIAYRATPILILLIVLLFWLRKKDSLFRRKILLSTAYFILLSFIVVLPLGLYFLENPADFFGRTTQISVFSSPSPLKDLTINSLKTAGMFNIRGDYNWRHNLSGRPELFWPVGILFLSGVIVGLRELIKRTRSSGFPFLVIGLWLVVAALPVVISNEGMPHALRAIIMIPPVVILAAVGGVKIYEWLDRKINNRNILRLVTIVFLAILVFEAYQSYFIRWARNPNTAGAFSQEYVKIAEELNKVPFETPKFVIVKAGGVDVRGLPMPTQTVMFLTDTFGETERQKKNFFYLTAAEAEKINIPPQAFLVTLE